MSTKVYPSHTEWMLFECERGKRWSSVTQLGEQQFDVDADGSFCAFSGCAENDHKIRQVKKSADRDECCDWFRG